MFICFIFLLISRFPSTHTHTHRRTKELTYNYVDRVRLAEHSLQQDYKCPSRGSGWRHNNKSISHLDLATSCHSTAFGPSHWPHNRQLRHSRSLDYAHLRDGCGKDPLDIAEFYWRLDPEVDALYEDDYEDELPDDEETVLTRYNNSEHHRQEQPYRDYNYVANNNQLLHPPHTHHNSGSSAGGSVSGVTSNSGKATTPASTATATLQAFDFGNESCSLRRSRSLAVIREETFSDLQITTTNNSRRSQLIPRARIVNRGFIRERERFICGSGGGGGANKHHHHHHHADGSSGNSANICEELDYEEGLNGVVEPNNNNSNNAVGSGEALDLNQRQHQHTHQRYHHHHHHASGGGNNSNHDNLQYQQKQQHHIHTELRLQSPAGGAQQAQQQQQQQQQHHHHSHNQQQSREADDYYDNLKRLDALTLGLVEQLHPWHNEKSDLESLNSDYFKNSLHQSHELDLQQQQKQQQQQQLDFEALEEAVSFLANEKPRIYQSRRQQRGLSSSLQKLHNATDSYQENSQSSAFPETTTSNSDDQTDSPSLSEQEYDLKKIEKIYQKTTELEADEEGYELISLTTTTRTRIETTEDEGDEEQHLDNNFNCVEQRADEFDWSNPRTADIKNTKEGAPINGVLKRTRALSENLEKLIAYDSVYLSSEESSESILLDEHHCGAYERTTQLTAQLAEDCGGETATLLHFSIEDIIYELPHTQQQKQNDTCELKAIDEEVDIEQLTTVACTETILTETETETEVGTETVEIATQTAQEKQLVSIVETVNTKIEKKPLTATTLDENTLESTTLYTQILKVGHTPATNPSAEPTSTSTAGKSPVTANTATATGTTGILKAAAVNSTTTQPSVGITSSAASKPKILSVVEKRKWKRYSDTTNNNSELIGQPARGACGLEPIVCSPTTPQIDYPLSAQKRQLTAIDSLTYLPYPTPTQLIDNQYHSLPDVSIGQSLKVSESIDAKLRSSYNIAHGSELVECCKRVTTDSSTSTNINTSGATSTKAPLLVENANKCKLKQQQREEVVTCEEIYDSIKRFGRAHQKARQKEYQELHEVHVEKGKDKEKKRELKEYSVKASVASAIAELEGDVQAATTYPDSLAEEIDIEQAQTLEEGVQSSTVFVQNTSTETNEADDSDSNITTKSSLATSASEYQEQPKDAPNETVENFSKLIERRAQEIKAKAASSKRTFGADDQKHLQSLTQAGRDEGTKAQELLQQQADDYEISTTSSQFRIIVTDAQDNIIEEDAIEQNDDSLNSDDKSSAPLWETPKLNLLTDITIRRQEKREKSTKDKSTIVSTHTRVASLKRVPSKPKRQQHHHCCQQQHNKYNSNKVKGNNSNGSRNHATTNGSFNSTSNDCHDSNNYCELSIKSKEHRVLSTQIYKARPIKVLTANDSFRRRSTEGAVTAAGSKMSRPQILHVVDNKRRGLADILGTGKNVSNNTSNKHSSSKVVKAVESSQIESEYLKKVDAVRNYWAKLAKEGDAQQTECDAPGESGREGEDVQRTPPLADWQTLSCAHKQENVNELPRRKQTEVVQATQPTQQAQQQPQQPQKPKPEPRHFILGPQPQQAAQEQTHTPSQQRNYAHSPCKPVKPGGANQDEFCSFMPSIEIVELDGDKKATIVSAVPPNSEDATALANDANGEPQFDHIRYKVLKSQQLLRSNMVPRSKKEAQFDGLIQYLQEYSFQELLANNNVVIVEPVRTKIERPLTIAQAAANVAATKKLARSVNEGGANTTVPNYALASDSGDKMTEEQAKISPTKDTHNKQSGVVKAWQQKANRVAGAGASGAAGSSASGIKRHFFYQPVRVNRELYEEELPNPDIVRNVRRFFEENVLPTPRGGMQLQHMLPPADGDTFVERSAATQLPSPRARRARKYRYLTIDTSYGHMPPQHQHHHQQSHESHQSKQQLQAQHTVTKHGSPSARKWDTASLSSGISSGDLSSPCECNELDTNCAAAKMAAVNGETLKGIHVQAAVQRHNNRNMQHIDGATDGGADDSNGLLQLRPRPRPRSCGVVRASEDPTYRVSNVYERHASQQQQRNFTRDEADNRPGGEIAATDDEDADEEDLDDEVYESHYVSNDVLEKIRECGSTVTYYGGRVLQSTSPDPMHNAAINSHNNNTQGNAANTNTMTLTRRRVRQIESCNACEPPKDCEHQQQQQQQQAAARQKFAHHNEGCHERNNKANVMTTEADDNAENSLAHFGIKFKLVKSNSCSSRLELAGTGAEIIETGADETEVVKKMVHRFECPKPQWEGKGKEELLTINSQTPARRLAAGAVATEEVTVNNHINVPMTTYTLDAQSTRAFDDEMDSMHYEDNKLENREHVNKEKTYESSAMDIYLSGGGNGGDDGNATLKVWRNKNVDLAYTMTKKQQQPTVTVAGETRSNATTNSDRNAGQSEPPQAGQPTTSTPASSAIVANMKRMLESNMSLKSRNVDSSNAVVLDVAYGAGSDFQRKINLSKTEVKQEPKFLGSNQYENEMPPHAAGAQLLKTQAVLSSTTAATPILAPRSTQLPAQIVVPVEIHRVDQQTPEPHGRTSVASSHGSSVTTVITTNTTTLLDKSVVRHYVANDKSLFEKRKYDDIEFEEFEVYDPTKDFEKLIENEKRREEAKRESQSQQQQQQEVHEQQQQSVGVRLSTVTLNGVSDSAGRCDGDENENEDEEDDGRKSKLGSDCYDYDSLEDKL